MTVEFQASLFDDALGGDEVRATTGATLGPLAGTVRRTHLSAGAWVDVRPGWVTGSDDLFLRLVDEVPWRAERRQMYERVVDVPRLLRFYGEGEPLPDPLLDDARDALSAYYADELGEPFTTAGMCYYRDGRDSVAWHGDRVGRRSRTSEGRDTMVAIVSFGEARRLSLRPKRESAPALELRGRPRQSPAPGGPATGSAALGFPLGHGDLIVMGGSCQRTWEHAILKSAKRVGPRISVQFRPRGVR